MLHISDLPNDILMLILEYYLKTETQERFLFCVSAVCNDWRKLCQDDFFWNKFDGSLSKDAFYFCCKFRYLLNTQEVKFTDDVLCHTSCDLKEIFHNLPNLKSAIFLNTFNFSENILNYLGQYCPKVSGIKLSFPLVSAWVNIPWNGLKNFIELCGKNLTNIDISDCDMEYFQDLLSLIAEECPNLEKLCLENIRPKLVFFVDIVQRGCPNMKELYLKTPLFFINFNKNSTLPGFPALEVFIHPTLNKHGSLNDEILTDILSESSNLKTLDIRGWENVTSHFIFTLSATHLKNIYLSMSKYLTPYGIAKIFIKWNRSLHTIELSNAGLYLPGKKRKVRFNRNYVKYIKSLNLSGVSVISKTILESIKSCEKLNSLTLITEDTIHGLISAEQSKDKEYYQREMKLLQYLASKSANNLWIISRKNISSKPAKFSAPEMDCVQEGDCISA